MGTTQPIRNKETLLQFRNYYKNVENKPRNYALIVLGLNSALRISDLLTLRWHDVLHHNNGLYRKHLSVVEQKTGKNNILALNTSSVEALECYRNSISDFCIHDYIFTSQKTPDEPLSRYQAYRIVKKAADYCGLNEHISCHSLRKTFGYHAWREGVPPAMLMSIYNHSSYDITKRYLCIDQAEKDEVYLKTFL